VAHHDRFLPDDDRDWREIIDIGPATICIGDMLIVFCRMTIVISGK